ncbi:MFS transporter [Pseudoalteromonas sp. SIMBA_153]
MSNLTKLTCAYFATVMSDWFYKLIIPLAIYKDTGSALYMAMSYAITYIPTIIFTLIGGVAADKYDRKKILVLGDALCALLSLAFLFAITHLDLDTLFAIVFAFFMSMVSAFYIPAHQSIVTQIIDEEDYIKANSLMRGIDNSLMVVVPTLSVFIISTFSLNYAIAINVVSFAFSALLISTIKLNSAITYTDDTEHTSFKKVWAQIVEGFNLAFSIKEVRNLCIMFVFVNIAISMFYSNFIYLLKEDLLASENEIGFAYSLAGIGALVGSFSARYIVKKYGEYNSVSLATIGNMCCFVFIHFANSAQALGTIWGGVNFFNSIIVIAYFTLRQKVVPKEKIGIVVAVTRSMVLLCVPLGAMQGGLLINYFNNGAEALKLGATGFMIIASLLAIFMLINQKKQASNIEESA